MKSDLSYKAILTGDIVGSTRLNPKRRQELFEIFSVLSKLLKEQYPQEISYEISNFRGDGWQMIVNHPEYSLEISLFIRTFIRYKFKEEKLDTRIAIGIGKTSFIPPENISAGDGPAYTISGHLLETLSSSRMAIGYAEKGDDLASLGAESLVLLIDLIITSWGPSQCQAVFWALHNYKQTEIAEKWIPTPIKQAAVSKSLKTAGWERIKIGLQFFKKFVSSTVSIL